MAKAKAGSGISFEGKVKIFRRRKVIHDDRYGYIHTNEKVSYYLLKLVKVGHKLRGLATLCEESNGIMNKVCNLSFIADDAWRKAQIRK